MLRVTTFCTSCSSSRHPGSGVSAASSGAEGATGLGVSRGVFNASDRPEAERKLTAFVTKWAEKAPKLAAWAEENVPDGFAVFDLGLTEAQRKRLRSTNSIENLNQQIKRRTRVARLFPNEASLLRLASAVLMETRRNGKPERGTCRGTTPDQLTADLQNRSYSTTRPQTHVDFPPLGSR